MGLDLPTVQLLCCAKNIGVDFSEKMTIGRQFIEKQPEFIATFGTVPEAEIAKIQSATYGEPLFRLLGAERICSLDASDYEGATHIHDLNDPISQPLHRQFSVVFDGGSLEHVFNLPQALKNCMEMIKEGGHFVQITAANNFMGHGFWQLSPEAIYSVFCEENGFATKAVLLIELARTRTGAIRTMPWYLVTAPAVCGGRVELVNRRRTFICTIAQRLANKEIYNKWPQQSDYLEKWKGSRAVQQSSQDSVVLSYLRRITPQPIKDLARAGIAAFQDEFDRSYYRRISPEDLMHGRLG